MAEEKGNYFQARPYKPFLLSIGAVGVTAEGKVVCHYVAEKNNIKDIYLLMRETPRPGETIEQTINRGLQEEFGATGTIKTYLGSFVARDKWFGEINQGTIVEKTTLYFLVDITSLDPTKRDANDEERITEIQTQDFDFLIEKMKNQFKRVGLNYFNESEIIERAQQIRDTLAKQDQP